MGKMWIGAVAVVLLAVGAAWVWLSRDGGVATGQLPYDDPRVVAQGQTIYADACAACHGVQLEGQDNWKMPDDSGLLPAPPHDVSGHTWHHPNAQLFAITKYGSSAIVGNGYQSNMKGFGDSLSDEEIIAVLAYIKSTWPARVITTHNRINAQAD